MPHTQELFEFFLSKYGLVVHTARRFAPHPDLVSDIVQQVYLELLKNAERKSWTLENEGTPLLYQITKNVSGKFWREYLKNKPSNWKKIAELLDEKYRSTETSGKLHEEHFKVDALNECLKKLSVKNRKLIDLRYFLGMPTKEIAGVFRIKQNSVQHILVRIRHFLAECIKEKTE